MRLPPIVILAWSLGLTPLVAQASDALNVGDPAPELKVARWLKGNTIEKLNPSRIQVVEFWATWCGPCKESIPHLTELAHQYRSTQVTFMGIAVWEPDPRKVKPFVDQMGAKMDYNVALDSVPPDTDPHDGVMARAWLRAAGEFFIPTAFVIKDGKVVWIGSPMNLDKPLAAIVAGTWDPVAFATRRQARRVVEEKTATINQRAVPLFKARKYQAFLKSLDQITAGNEAVARQFAGLNLPRSATAGTSTPASRLGAYCSTNTTTSPTSSTPSSDASSTPRSRTLPTRAWSPWH